MKHEIEINLTGDKMPEPHHVVIVAGGIATWTGSSWVTQVGHDAGRAILWPVLWWTPLLFDGDIPATVEEQLESTPDLSRVQSGWASPEAVDEMSIAITTLRAALHFIADLTGEVLETARVGTGEEVALRHAHRRAKDALEGQP